MKTIWLGNTAHCDCCFFAPHKNILIFLFTFCRLNYSNGLLVRVSVYLQRRLQSMLTGARRLIFLLGPNYRINNSWWVRVSWRIKYKTAALSVDCWQLCTRDRAAICRTVCQRRRCDSTVPQALVLPAPTAWCQLSNCPVGNSCATNLQ